MKGEVYLDYSATTPVDSLVIEAMVEMMKKDYGNPSSLHRMGLQAEKKISKAREQVAKAIGVKPKEIIFTSGGTEANNLAIRGAAYYYSGRGKHLITTAIEHPSVLDAFKDLEKEGFEVTYLPVDKEGFVDIEELKNAITPKTTLVSIMHVNNEIGSVQPIAEIGKIIKEKDNRIIFHVDAVQSYGKLEINPSQMEIDLLTISGHKIHGPKGIGALYINEKVNLKPLVYGGGQERDLRSGTENVPGIIGLGVAAELISVKMKQGLTDLVELKSWFLERVKNEIPGVKINGPANIEDIKIWRSAPHIINLSFPGIKAEVLLHSLEDYGIYVSTGSACHSRKSNPSHVLQAIKLSKAEVEGAIRISLSYNTSKKDLEYLLQKLPGLVADLRRLMVR